MFAASPRCLVLAIALAACSGQVVDAASSSSSSSASSSSASSSSASSSSASSSSGGVACAPPSFPCGTGCETKCGGCWDLCPDQCPASCGNIEILASGATSPGPLALDDSAVYWGDNVDGTLKVVPKSGGTPMLLASGQGAIFSVAVDSSRVFWNHELAIQSMPKTGGTPMLLASTPPGYASFFVTDTTSLYYIDDTGLGSPTLDRIAKGGGLPGPLTSLDPTIPQGSQMAVSSSYLYFAAVHDPEVKRVPAGGGAVEPVATGMQPGALVADAAFVYWLDGQDVLKSPVGGGSTQVVASLDMPFHLALDAQSVYVGCVDGAIQKIALAGGSPTMLANGPDLSADSDTLAVDDAYVYWSVDDTQAKGGLILRTPK